MSVWPPARCTCSQGVEALLDTSISFSCPIAMSGTPSAPGGGGVVGMYAPSSCATKHAYATGSAQHGRATFSLPTVSFLVCSSELNMSAILTVHPLVTPTE